MGDCAKIQGVVREASSQRAALTAAAAAAAAAGSSTYYSTPAHCATALSPTAGLCTLCFYASPLLLVAAYVLLCSALLAAWVQHVSADPHHTASVFLFSLACCLVQRPSVSLCFSLHFAYCLAAACPAAHMVSLVFCSATRVLLCPGPSHLCAHTLFSIIHVPAGLPCGRRRRPPVNQPVCRP